MADEDVKRALMEALGMGQRPRSRPPGMRRMPTKKDILQGGAQGGMSDKDIMLLEMLTSKGSGPPTKKEVLQGGAEGQMSDKDIEYLEQLMRQQQGVRDKAERKAFPPASMMNRGGEVKRKKKPKMGAVMKGRGGSYKGIK